MPLVKVWNMNVHPLEERFKGDVVRIPAGGYHVMDEEEAWQYHGQFKPILLDADGGKDPRGFKMLKIEPHDGTQAAPKTETKINPLQCMGCSYLADNDKDLKEHQDVMHAEQRKAHEKLQAEGAKVGKKTA